MSTAYAHNYTVLMTGDSNSRIIFRSVQKLIRERGRITQRETITKDGEKTQWSDLEFTGILDDSVLRVRFVFLHDQGELKEVYEGREHILLSPMPDLVWFTHGLWHIDNKYDMPCENRFVIEGNFIDTLKNKTRVVWQTNVKVKKHPRIEDRLLLKDTLCQYAWAKRKSIEIFDIRNYPIHGFHLTDGLQIASRIIKYTVV